MLIAPPTCIQGGAPPASRQLLAYAELEVSSDAAAQRQEPTGKRQKIVLEGERVRFTAACMALSSRAGISCTDVFLYRSP